MLKSSKIILALNILTQILSTQGQYFPNHVKVSSRLDLSGSLKNLCTGDDSNDENEEVSCECLGKLAISSTVQVGKFHDVYEYQQSHQDGANTYTSLRHTIQDVNVQGLGRFHLNNVKCVENNEVTDIESLYTHWFQSYFSYYTLAEPNGLMKNEMNEEVGDYVHLVIENITSENAPKLVSLILEKDDQEIYRFEDDLGSICGESLKEGSWERAIWSLFDQAFFNNDNNCFWPEGHKFAPSKEIPLVLTIDEPLKCGDYLAQFSGSIHNDVFIEDWTAKIYFYLEEGGFCSN